MAGFSFSLYCTHTPLITAYGAFLMATLGLGWKMVPNGPLPYALALSSVLMAILFAWGFGHLTERNTGRLRDLVRSWRSGRTRLA